MLIAVEQVRAGDIAELPSGRVVRVERVDEYPDVRLLRRPSDNLMSETATVLEHTIPACFVVRWRQGDHQGSLHPRQAGAMVQLAARARSRS